MAYARGMRNDGLRLGGARLNAMRPEARLAKCAVLMGRQDVDVLVHVARKGWLFNLPSRRLTR
jgi:hypothetical protein